MPGGRYSVYGSKFFLFPRENPLFDNILVINEIIIKRDLNNVKKRKLR